MGPFLFVESVRQNIIERLTDAPAVGGRLDLDESLVVHAKMAGTPALEPEMFLGLRGGPGG